MELDIKRQVEHWSAGAVDNLETAGILIDKGKRLEGLFFCHLAIEKALKAHVTKATNSVPPKTHNLVRLAELSGLPIKEEDFQFFGRMMEFQIEGRYPEVVTKCPDKKTSLKYLRESKEFVEWLNARL